MKKNKIIINLCVLFPQHENRFGHRKQKSKNQYFVVVRQEYGRAMVYQITNEKVIIYDAQTACSYFTERQSTRLYVISYNIIITRYSI